MAVHNNDAEADADADADEIEPDGQLDGICGSVADCREKETIAHSNKAWKSFVDIWSVLLVNFQQGLKIIHRGYFHRYQLIYCYLVKVRLML